LKNFFYIFKLITLFLAFLFISEILTARAAQNIREADKFSNILKCLKDSSTIKKLFVAADYMQMRATHGDYFRGATVMVGYRYSPHFYYGLGIKYAYNYFHFDNDWYLHHLNFLPIYVFARFNFLKEKLITPYFHTSLGITFAKYEKEDRFTMGHPYTVREQGLYLNSGFGCAVKPGKHFNFLVEAGFQGFHMSTDQFAVNPHGVNLQIGILW
jgi:hypothetical protein